jgi:hypothetical protein
MPVLVVSRLKEPDWGFFGTVFLYVIFSYIAAWMVTFAMAHNVLCQDKTENVPYLYYTSKQARQV